VIVNLYGSDRKILFFSKSDRAKNGSDRDLEEKMPIWTEVIVSCMEVIAQFPLYYTEVIVF